MALGRPLLELYRRLQGWPNEDGHVYQDGRELAEYVVEFATADRKGACEAITLIGLVALDAGRDDVVRWLLHPDGQANPLLDDRDRHAIASYPAYVEQVRATGASGALGQHGLVAHDPYLEHLGYTAPEARAFRKRAYRFLKRARVDRRAPAILRTLPGFAPIGLHFAFEESARASTTVKVGAVATVAIVIAVAIWSWPAAAKPDDNATADTAFAVNLDGQSRVVLGWRDGRWRIAHPDGATEYEPPAGLLLPSFVEGGTAGDLTGDGIAELVLFSSVPLEAFDRHETGIWIFTRDGTAWRLLDQIATQPGPLDRAACVRVRDQIARATQLTLELHRARQRCPSRIGALTIHDRALHVVQLHYGRQYLRATCDSTRCSELAPVVAVDADVTSIAPLAADKRDVLAMGTACWNRFGTSAYGVLVHRGDAPAFTWTGGRTVVAAIDRARLAVFTGSPCEGLFQQAVVAANVDALVATADQHTLAIAELADDGVLRILDRVRIDQCCGEAHAITVLGAAGAPAYVAIAYRESDADVPHHLRLYDLGRALSDQTPFELALGSRTAKLSTLDVDGDHRDELIVSALGTGTTVYEVVDRELRVRSW